MAYDRPLADVQVCKDGTEYAVHSELVRGEPRFYWVVRQSTGPHQGQHELAARVEYGGSYSRTSAQRAARRIAVKHDTKS
jgi:hypothetical protein